MSSRVSSAVSSVILLGVLASQSAVVEARGRATEQTVLPLTHICSPTLYFRAQEMSYQQFVDSCNEVGSEEGYFHQRLETQGLPVANDQNEDLRMVIFDDYNQYNTYGKRLFNINTNNGGMYIEGNATDSNNQASFYAHEASWLRPEFVIWNLKHEYVHYLDGRFNLRGNFSDYPTNTVWWSEGLAEYISKQDSNADAIALINPAGNNRTLAQVYATTYSNTVEEIYDWGYLANRFMFEQQMAAVRELRNATRNSDWSNYQTLLGQWGSSYEQQWQNWLLTLATNGLGAKQAGSVVSQAPVISPAQQGSLEPQFNEQAKGLAHQAYHLRAEAKSLTISLQQQSDPALKARLKRAQKALKTVETQRAALAVKG